MKDMRFTNGDEVRVGGRGGKDRPIGKVIGVAQFTGGPDQYFVAYTDTDGASYERWLLDAAVFPVKP